MVREVFRSSLHAPIVFAGNDDESIGTANFMRIGTAMASISSASSPGRRTLNHEFSEPDTHPVGKIGAVKDEDAVADGKPR
jgi:hypothetical protein